jgi:poly-gamma-glutamate capsule biosynthesis protein CapA/YwtB (metallophosphatase superfamily)
MAFSSDEGLPSGGVGGALGPIRGALKADVVTGNLEGTLTSGGSSKCGGGSGGTCFAFRAPTSYARGFRRAGFDVLNMANNHAHDFGDGALAETASALRGAGIVPVGVGSSITTLRVGDAKLAFVGFSSYPWSASLLDLGAAQSLVRAAAASADLVVVMFHGGAEGADRTHTPFGSETAFGENRGNLRAFAHAVIDAGAGLVLGSGPHVIRGIERYRDRLVAYSLGNFAGPNTLGSSGVTGLSAVLRLRLTDQGDVLGGRWIPVALQGGLPRLDPSRRSVALVRSLSFSDFKSRFPITSTGRILPAP